jgi:NAD(P)-dependent dehydrogenase (short-subunit alcohol dehydrogenase family)
MSESNASSKTSEPKCALITGGSSGIGLATAHALVRRGWRVILVARSRDLLENSARELGESALTFVADVSAEAQMRELTAFLEQRALKLDALFVNAGIAEFQPLESAELPHFDRVMNINVRGAFLTVKQCLPFLKNGSSLVFNTSVAASIGAPWCSVYSASKGALESMARSLAAELMPRGVRVNCLSPGPSATPILMKAQVSDEGNQLMAPYVMQRMRMGRLGNPSEVAEAAVFLLTESSSFITGQSLAVDGGMSGI